MKNSVNRSQKLFKKWISFAKRAMTLALMVSCAGCVSTALPLPSITQSPSGNAILTTLPVGTLLTLPSPQITAQMRSLLLNETEAVAEPPCTLRLNSPLKLATPAYIRERDAAWAATLLTEE